MKAKMYQSEAKADCEITLTIPVSKSAIEELRKISRMMSKELHEKYGADYGQPCAGIHFETPAIGYDMVGFIDYYLSEEPDELPELYAELYDATADHSYIFDDGGNHAIEDKMTIVMTCDAPDAKDVILEIMEED